MKKTINDPRIPDQATLAKEVLAWYQERNNKKVKVDWQFTVQDA